MNLVLVRIDDRFIHGQVVVGWGQRLRPDLIILANDEIAADSWQTRVYAHTVPQYMAVSVLALLDAAAALRGSGEITTRPKRTILLAGSPADMHRLISLGASFEHVNVGGMHYASGKQQLLPSVYVDRGDLKAFRALLGCGVRLAAQAVPGGRELPIDDTLLAAAEARL